MLLDQLLPDMPGLDLLQRLSREGISVPVLMVTGALFYVAFLFLVPVRAVRELVDDVTEQLWSAVRGVFPQNKSPAPVTRSQ